MGGDDQPARRPGPCADLEPGEAPELLGTVQQKDVRRGKIVKKNFSLGVVSTVTFGNPGLQDRRPFRITLPDGPFSFSGKLISLAWALELVIEPGSRATRTEITVSPTRMEILIAPGVPAG